MCDTLCVHHGDGTWFAKNSDRPPSEVQVFESHSERPVAASGRQMQYLTIPDAPAFAVCGSRPTWLRGFEHGLNRHGLAVGNERIWTTTPPRGLPPALLGMDIVRLVLERARDADEALAVCTDLVGTHGQGGSGEPDRDDPYFSSFLIVDPQRGWVVETDGRSWAARPTGAGAAISNRVSLGRDWTLASSDIAAGTDFDERRDPRVPTEIADGRLAVTSARVADGAVDLAALAATLRDHGSGAPVLPRSETLADITVCMHRPDLRSQTTAAMIAHLRSDRPPRAWVCAGNPCLGVFVPVFPPQVPLALSDPAEWIRFAALRDEVGNDPDRALRVRTAFAEIETTLWDEADAAELAGPTAVAAFTESAYTPIDAALRGLGH